MKYVNVYQVDLETGSDKYYTSGYVIDENELQFSLVTSLSYQGQGKIVFTKHGFYYEIDLGD